MQPRRPAGGPELPARRAPLAVALAAALALAACGAFDSPTPTPAPTPTPTPTATPTPTPSPTPTPTPAPTATPTPTATPDAAAGLAIGDPWAIDVLDPSLDTLFRKQFSSAVGAFGAIVKIGTRQVTNDGALRAYVFVLDFPPALTKMPEFWPQLISGMTSSGGTTPKVVKVSGVDVRTIETGGTTVSAFLLGSRLLMVVAIAPAELLPITKALIAANR